ncbi:MAG: hypothetical protein QNJ22_04940 [Desulfosarcinaceae bacterium]|nr:hypothetical protein [Desulfosarcinaceae bacterium]
MQAARVVFNDIFAWDGWGGRFNLAAGKCRLCLFDLSGTDDSSLTLLKPFIAIATDLRADGSNLKKVTVRACCTHIATTLARRFAIEPARMLFVEYYPRTHYGRQQEHTIPERYDIVDMVWQDEKALHPKWRPLEGPLLETVRSLLGIARKTAPF